MAQSENIKCSGTRLEVSVYQLPERGGVRKAGLMGVKGHCYAHKRFQGHSRGYWEHLLHFSQILDFFTQFRHALPLRRNVSLFGVYLVALKK